MCLADLTNLRYQSKRFAKLLGLVALGMASRKHRKHPILGASPRIQGSKSQSFVNHPGSTLNHGWGTWSWSWFHVFQWLLVKFCGMFFGALDILGIFSQSCAATARRAIPMAWFPQLLPSNATQSCRLVTRWSMKAQETPKNLQLFRRPWTLRRNHRTS